MKKIILIFNALAFIFLGMEFNYPFLLFSMATTIFIFIDGRKIKINKINLLIITLWLIYFLSLYLFGYSRLTNNDELTYFRFIFTIFYILILSSYLNNENLISSLKIFCLFTWIAQLIIISHSYYLDPNYYGRGRLFFYQTNLEINSPIIGILLSVSLSLLLLLSKKIKLVTKVSMLTISILLLLYIGSRTGLMIIILSLILSLDFKQKKTKIITSFFSTSILLTIISFFYIDSHLAEVNSFIDKLTQRGIESPRYLMWEQGIYSLLDYPFGGMTFNVSGYQGIWFHNILLDTVRTSGLIPLIIILSLFAFYLFRSLILKNKNALFINLIIIISMMSDVIVEGGGAIRLIFMLIIFNTTIQVNKEREKNGHNLFNNNHKL